MHSEIANGNTRRGAGVVDRAALEMRCTGNCTGGSNPSLSASTSSDESFSSLLLFSQSGGIRSACCASAELSPLEKCAELLCNSGISFEKHLLKQVWHLFSTNLPNLRFSAHSRSSLCSRLRPPFEYKTTKRSFGEVQRLVWRRAEECARPVAFRVTYLRSVAICSADIRT